MPPNQRLGFDPMTQCDSVQVATWEKIIDTVGDENSHMPWNRLIEIAAWHHRWLMAEHDVGARTGGDNLNVLVAALFVPHADRGRIYLSTIPRGFKHAEMRQQGHTKAPLWSKAVHDSRGKPPSVLRAEDGAIFLFETRHFGVLYFDEAASKYSVPYPNLGRMRIVCFGKKNENQAAVVPLCSGEGKSPRSSVDVVNTLNIEYWTLWADKDEKMELAEKSGPSGPSGGGKQQGKRVQGSPSHHALPSTSHASGSGSGTSYTANQPTDSYRMIQLTRGMGGMELSSRGSPIPLSSSRDSGRSRMSTSNSARKSPGESKNQSKNSKTSSPTADTSSNTKREKKK